MFSSLLLVLLRDLTAPPSSLHASRVCFGPRGNVGEFIKWLYRLLVLIESIYHSFFPDASTHSLISTNGSAHLC